MNELNYEIFGKNLIEEVVAFSHISCATISGIIWEERIVNALVAMDLSPKWKMGSHRSGTDIEILDLKFSGKSQKAERDIFLFSSFRTTKFKKLEEKIYFIDNPGKNFTHYLILSQEISKDDIIYIIYMIEADFIKASDFEWKCTQGKTEKTIKMFMGWETKWKDGVQLRIVKSMSDQLWIYIEKERLINNDKVKILGSATIKKSDIGSSWLYCKEQVFNVRNE